MKNQDKKTKTRRQPKALMHLTFRRGKMRRSLLTVHPQVRYLLRTKATRSRTSVSGSQNSSLWNWLSTWKLPFTGVQRIIGSLLCYPSDQRQTTPTFSVCLGTCYFILDDFTRIYGLSWIWVVHRFNSSNQTLFRSRVLKTHEEQMPLLSKLFSQATSMGLTWELVAFLSFSRNLLMVIFGT